MSAEWFVNWFNSPYYDLLYQKRNEQEASEFLDKLLVFLQPPPKSVMLDLPCGNGRHSVYLSRRGYEVIGADLSRAKIFNAKKLETDTLMFMVHDIREIFYVNYFDYVFNLFTSLGYFRTERENLNAIRTLSRALKSGGKLVIDFMNTEKLLKDIANEENKIVSGVQFNIRKRIEDKSIIKDINITHGKRSYHYQERVQTLSLHDFENYFSANELKTIKLFGNYKLNDFNPNESNRLIIIAEKL